MNFAFRRRRIEFSRATVQTFYTPAPRAVSAGHFFERVFNAGISSELIFRYEHERWAPRLRRKMERYFCGLVISRHKSGPYVHVASRFRSPLQKLRCSRRRKLNVNERDGTPRKEGTPGNLAIAAAHLVVYCRSCTCPDNETCP